MYDFMKETLVATGFMFIIMLDIWGIGYWIVKLVKWVKKKLRKAPDEEVPAEAAETETE